MAVVTTPLGFQKPDGYELVRDGENVISANATLNEVLHSNARARLAQVESAAGFPGTGLDLTDSAVNPLLDTATTTRNKLDARYTRGSNGANVLPVEFGLPGGWTAGTSNVPTGANVSYSTTSSRYLATAGASDFIPLDASKFYRYSFDLHSDITGQVTYIDVNWKDKAKVGLGATPRILSNYTIPANVWTPISGYIGTGMGVVPIVGTAGINPFVYANHPNGTQGGTLSIADFRIVDVTEVVDLVRGSTFIATAALNGTMLAVDKAKLDNAVSTATASRLAIRDASGRIAVADPAAAGDAATKNYVDSQTALKASAQSAVDLNYYVSTTGNNSNDGLTAGAPFLTVQKAVDVAAAKSLGNDKKAVINVAAGTYAGRVIVPAFTENRLNITIQGPEVAHPGVPTVTQTEGTNATAVAFGCENTGSKLTVRNIKFVGYRGSTASAGISVGSGTFLKTENVHYTDCYWGVSGFSSEVDVKGGIFTTCGALGTSGTGNGAGVRSLQRNRHSIGTQNAGNLASGPEFRNCQAALFLQELSTGHVDWCTIEDCVTGVSLAVNARANLDGTSFKRNTIDIRNSTGSNASISANTAFGTGADESSIKILNSSGATISDSNRIFTNILQSNAGALQGADTAFPNATVTATITQVVYTATLAAPMWRNAASSLGKNRKLNVKIYGTLAGTADVKDVTVRLGAAIVSASFVAADAGGFQAEADIFFTGTNTQYLSMRAYRHLGATLRVSTADGTNEMTANANLTVEARVGNVADSVTIKAVELSWA